MFLDVIVEEVFIRSTVVANRAAKPPVVLMYGFSVQPARHVRRELLRAVIASNFPVQRMRCPYVFPQVEIPLKHFLTNIAFYVFSLLVVSQSVLVSTAQPAKFTPIGIILIIIGLSSTGSLILFTGKQIIISNIPKTVQLSTHYRKQ